jgi:hypothetical protein
MHPDDESTFAEKVLSETGTVFVDGPIWAQPQPPITKDIRTAGDYLMIWNSLETPELTGTHHRKEEKEWWYCNNEFLTIQFLRSGFHPTEPFLVEGRIAVCTTSKEKNFYHESSAGAIERRFKFLRNFIKKAYANKALIWQAISSPRSNSNPIKPDPCVWVSPNAMAWLEEEPRKRFVQQFRTAGASAYLLDLVE